MKDEIKEILDKLKDNDWYEELDTTGTKWIELKQEETKILLDYITNLQTIEQQYSAILSENAELQQAKDKLQNDYQEAIDKITNLQEEVNKLTAESTEWESKCYKLQEENQNLRKELELCKKNGNL